MGEQPGGGIGRQPGRGIDRQSGEHIGEQAGRVGVGGRSSGADENATLRRPTNQSAQGKTRAN